MRNTVRRPIARSTPSNIWRFFKRIRILQLQRDRLRYYKRAPPLQRLGPQRDLFFDPESDPVDPANFAFVYLFRQISPACRRRPHRVYRQNGYLHRR